MTHTCYIVVKDVNEAVQAAALAAQTMQGMGVQVLAETHMAERLQLPSFELQQLQETAVLDSCENQNLMLCIGGDGTFLWGARIAAPLQIPVFGINLGTLGFLTEFEIDDIGEQTQNFLDGKLKIQSRTVMDVTVMDHSTIRHQLVAINDAVLNKNALSRMLELDVSVSETESYSVRSDGIIVSTPTGSTAYNISAGGPIIAPQLDVLVLNPICPIGLSNRPLVVPAEAPIRLRVTSGKDVYITVDGQEGHPVPSGAHIEIRKSSTPLQLVTNSRTPFVDLLRQKLWWGQPNYRQKR